HPSFCGLHFYSVGVPPQPPCFPDRIEAARSARQRRVPPAGTITPRHGDSLHPCAGRRIFMKVVVSFVLTLALVCSAALPTFAEPRQVIQGTEVHLTLLTPISSSSSHEGDPFVAVLAQPVAFDSRIVLPVGTRLN